MRTIVPPANSKSNTIEYQRFLENAYKNMIQAGCLSRSEGIDSLELAHLIPSVPDTMLAIHLGINDATCTKSLATRFLPSHAHHNVFAFDPEVYSGLKDVPEGTRDMRQAVVGFETPNKSWESDWTYVHIVDPKLSPQQLWACKGFIDLLPGKNEDFHLLTDSAKGPICFFVEEQALDNSVNRSREYLIKARKTGWEMAGEFKVPKGLEKGLEGLVPVILDRGQRLYIPSQSKHAWSAILHQNMGLPIVSESSAIPTSLIYNKPQRPLKYSDVIPSNGSADMTNDVFADEVYRLPLLQGAIKG